jgi:hypothetical protein
VAKAIRVADEIAAAVEPYVEIVPEMADAFVALPCFTRMRFQRWDDLLAAPSTRPHLNMSAVFRHFGRAFGLHAKQRTAEARREQAEF